MRGNNSCISLIPCVETSTVIGNSRNELINVFRVDESRPAVGSSNTNEALSADFHFTVSFQNVPEKSGTFWITYYLVKVPELMAEEMGV
jgi:hypothetical protein